MAFELKDKEFKEIYYGVHHLLYQTARDTFWFRSIYGDTRFVFTIKNANDITATQTFAAGRSRTMRKIDPVNMPTDKQLMAPIRVSIIAPIWNARMALF